MVIARALYQRYPNEPEGDLSRRYNGLVDRDTCAEIGREIGVPALIRLGKQAREDGASRSENVVGDVVEALIGALFIDGGPKLRNASSCDLGTLYSQPTARAPASEVGASGACRGKGNEASGI